MTIISTALSRARTISRGEMHWPKLQPSGWASRIRVEARRKEERDCPWWKAAISCALLQAGVRPPDGRRALCSPLVVSRILSFLSLSASQSWQSKRCGEIDGIDERRRMRRKGAGRRRAQLAELLPERTSSLSCGKEKDKNIYRTYNKLSLVLSFSLFTQAASNSWRKSIAWLKNRNSRSLARFTRHNLPNSARSVRLMTATFLGPDMDKQLYWMLLLLLLLEGT